MKKQIYFLLIALLLVFTVSLIDPLDTNADNSLSYQDEGTKPLAVVPSFYTDIYSRGIAWTTMAGTPDSTVQYLEKVTENFGAIDWSKAMSVTGTSVTYDESYYCHKAIISDLEPGKEYYYRVGCASLQSWSEPAVIRTDDNAFDAFTFLFATDPQQDSKAGFQYFADVVKAAYQTYPNASFMFNGGDMANDAYDQMDHDYDQWIWAMELPKKQIMNSVFMAVAGNHESYGNAFADRYAMNYQGATAGGGYLSFDYGNVHFVLLNTNEWYDAGNAQLTWLENDLQTTDKDWKVILLHKGLISTGDHSLDSDVEAIRENLFPLMAKYEVDLVLQGHDHVYVRSRPYLYGTNAMNNYYTGKTPNFEETTVSEIHGDEEIVYSIEPNGTFYVTGNYSGSKSYAPVGYDQNLIYPSQNPFTGKLNSAQVEQTMFAAITIDGNSLIYKAYTFDGKETVTLYDQYAIRKNTHLPLVSLLQNLPEAEQSSVFDLEEITQAVNAYNSLTPAGKAKLTDEEEAKIKAYIEKYDLPSAVKAKDVATEIANLGSFEMTEAFRLKMKAVRKNYLALSESERSYVENYKALTDAETMYYDHLKADAVSEMIALYENNDPHITEDVLRNAYEALNDAQKQFVVNPEIIPAPKNQGNLLGILGIIGAGLLLIGAALFILLKVRKGKLRKSTLLQILLAACIAVTFSCLGTPKASAASSNEQIGTDWEISENAIDLTAEDIEEGGIGYLTYRTVPSESGQGEPINNSVTIPVENYDVTSQVVSIKYQTNMDVSAKNITLYVLVEDLNVETNEMETKLVLFGWFVNWNVTAGKTEDGYSMITADHKNYSGTGTVVGIVMNFNFVPKTGAIAYMSLLGIDFHLKEEKPVFATDPRPASLDAPTVSGTGYQLDAAENGWKISVSDDASGTVEFTVHDWSLKVANSIQMDVTPTSGQTLKVYANTSLVDTQVFSGSEKTFVDIPVATIALLRTLKLEITGAGTMTVANLQLTKKPAIENYTTSNADYFTKIEDVTDPELLAAGYQVHVIRNNRAGYPKFVLKTENYRPEYDVICIYVKTVSGVSLLGINVADSNYLINHNDSNSFLNPGKEYAFTFFYPYRYDPNWNQGFNIYVNPNSLSRGDYKYTSEFYLGFEFKKSSDFKTPEYTVNDAPVEKTYDGKPVTIAATVATAGLKATTTYYCYETKKESTTAPVNTGTYTAKVVIQGNAEYKQVNIDVPITILPQMQRDPVLSEIHYDTVTHVLTFPADYEVNIAADFNPNTMVTLNSTVEAGTALFVRRQGDAGHSPSNVMSYTAPQKADTPALETEKVKATAITVKPIAGAEYRIIQGDNASEWKAENTFTELLPDTEYRIEARIPSTDTVCESEIGYLEVRTLAKDAGCSSTIGFASLSLWLSALGLFAVVRYRKSKKSRIN